MKIGIIVENFGGFPETGRGARACVDLAKEAENLGFDSVWVTDHIALPKAHKSPYPHNSSGEFPYSWEQDIHDPLMLMAALAQATDRVEIGVSVLVIPYRHPLTTAKMLATADQLSNGRIILGAGVGWLGDEFEALSLPEEYFKRRGAVTVDYIRAMQAAWTAETWASYSGEFVQYQDMGVRPQPARKPHLPVWIGGKGERALRRTVALGDGYLAISADAPTLATETENLRQLAEQEGRDPDSITVAEIGRIVMKSNASAASRQSGVDGLWIEGNSQQVLEGLGEFADAGLDHIVAGIGYTRQTSFSEALEALQQFSSEVLPEAHKL